MCSCTWLDLAADTCAPLHGTTCSALNLPSQQAEQLPKREQLPNTREVLQVRVDFAVQVLGTFALI